MEEDQAGQNWEHSFDTYLLQKSLLILTIKSAHNLKKVDFISQSDPFVEVTFKGQTVRTETIDNNCNPYWNNLISFTIEDVR